MVNTFLIIWFVIAILSAAYLAWDAFRKNPEFVVMKWGWLLVALYTGPVALSFYILADKEPAPGQHEEFVRPLWKQGLGSMIHCLAGDATAIIVAAAVTTSLGFPMWLDSIVEYVAGFTFGLFIFQALFMKDMMGGSYGRAVTQTVIPEWLSMNTVMAGMLPVMVILMSRHPAAASATSLQFWGIMSLATLVGGIVAYPVNVWLVGQGLKHGLGTVRAPGCAKLCAPAGNTAVRVATGYLAATHAVTSHVGKPVPHHDMLMDGNENGVDAHHGRPAGEEHAMQMRGTVTRPQLLAVTSLTLQALAAGLIVAGVYGNFAM